MPAGPSSRFMQHQRGVALLVVLWACTLLAVLLGGLATLAKTDATQTRYLSTRAQLRYLAEAGVMRAIAEITAKKNGRWVGDGRPYGLVIDGQRIDVRIVDDSGKVDINKADPPVLQNLFVAAGMDAADAATLADNVRESRDAGGAFNREEGAQRYARGGLDQGPRYAEFNAPDEIQSVLGMTPELYRKIAPVLTVWSHRMSPAPAFAPPLALAALPGMDMVSAERFVSMRSTLNPVMPPVALPNGMPMGAMRGSDTRTVVASATAADGTTSRISATVRIEVFPGRGSYTVLRWQEDAAE
ncbi:type II secretion system protein GspK [Dyella sedimenti]|uniref:type II secretion system protein GspK n=1 Tax=Dyella sedimenti TaxID=2919947 RepID=UPI001FA96988|nr:type II secretion system protein GspK [Dyella sedimenti]